MKHGEIIYVDEPKSLDFSDYEVRMANLARQMGKENIFRAVYGAPSSGHVPQTFGEYWKLQRPRHPPKPLAYTVRCPECGAEPNRECFVVPDPRSLRVNSPLKKKKKRKLRGYYNPHPARDVKAAMKEEALGRQAQTP